MALKSKPLWDKKSRNNLYYRIERFHVTGTRVTAEVSGYLLDDRNELARTPPHGALVPWVQNRVFTFDNLGLKDSEIGYGTLYNALKSLPEFAGAEDIFEPGQEEGKEAGGNG